MESGFGRGGLHDRSQALVVSSISAIHGIATFGRFEQLSGRVGARVALDGGRVLVVRCCRGLSNAFSVFPGIGEEMDRVGELW